MVAAATIYICNLMRIIIIFLYFGCVCVCVYKRLGFFPLSFYFSIFFLCHIMYLIVLRVVCAFANTLLRDVVDAETRGLVVILCIEIIIIICSTRFASF